MTLALRINKEKFGAQMNKAQLAMKLKQTRGISLDPKLLNRGIPKMFEPKPEPVPLKETVVHSLLLNQNNKHMNTELIHENIRKYETDKLRRKGQFLTVSIVKKAREETTNKI